jgi:hypothetical protein
MAISLTKNKTMIQNILADIEMDVKHQIYNEQKKLIAVKNLKEILSHIDHEVEVVPVVDKERLSSLLVSLKGQSLSDDEYRMIEKVVSFRN